MAASSSKAKFLGRVYTLLKQHYGRKKPSVERPVLDQLIYGLVAEDTTDRVAGDAFRRLKTQYVDWNEVRVTSVRELRESMRNVADSTRKAEAIRSILGRIFEKNHQVRLPDLQKVSLRDAVKALGKLPGASDFAIATVVQQTLAGHAIPTDATIGRVIARLGLADPRIDLPVLRGSLERLVAKTRAFAFTRLVHELAFNVCVPERPKCPQCPLVKMCPTGRERTTASPAVRAAKRTAATKRPAGKADKNVIKGQS